MANCADPTRKQAWEIASDPAASESKWIAAVTVLDGIKHGGSKPKLPTLLAAPWVITLSAAGACGGFLLFALMHLIVCSSLTEFFGEASYLSVAFGIWFVPVIVFNMLFTYQKLNYNAGRSWTVLKWVLCLGYLTAISAWAIDGQPVRPWDAGLLIAWNTCCVAAGILGTKIAETTFKSLNQTIGSSKIISGITWTFASLPLVMTGLFVTGILASFIMPHNMLIFVLGGILLISSYMVTRSIAASSTRTGASVASIVWAPFLMANLALFPVMVATHAWLVSTGGPFFVSWTDYCTAFGVFAISALTPPLGGALAGKHLQSKAAISCLQGRDRIYLADSARLFPAEAANPASITESDANRQPEPEQ